ncbi:protein phosphatase 2C domain-containing protein [Nonomuraea sp. MCN248]|uniref:Protein phosphatase 2C domain-containing protein n=1 Tax=Nonomuraea corallina TaxID=2989783 RepID=A0ABT4S3X3_9ACTN|nr:protein phosphatase 2C domain-containing protein [Nonomuraea corallina]MDA0631879.1 protein phosphatase 2C domain-containing protein [Nonomuraea corallina]
MRVALATEAAPGRPNEDFAAVSADAAVLLDGAGTPGGSESGCSHGVAWFARTLGSSLLAAMTQKREPLPELLAGEIKAVAGLHEDTCDLGHPGSPSATVVMLRRTDDALEWLVLADSSLVLGTGGTAEPMVICDDREAQVGARYRSAMDALDSGSPEHQAAHRDYVEALRAHRNRDGGFWVAVTDPLAADQALTGTAPRESVRTAVLLSDGASRLVDRFHLATWRQALDLLDQEGPEALISRVRAAEYSDPTGSRWPRGKTFDDATVVTLSLP